MNFVTFLSVPYIAHVDAGVLCDEVRNCLLQINQLKSGATLTNWKKADISKYWLNTSVLSICLTTGWIQPPWHWPANASTNSDLRPRKNIVCECVWVCVGVCTHVRMCVCMCACVYVCVCDFVRMCVCVYARAFCFYFIMNKDALHADSLNNTVLFLYKCICYRHARILRNVTIIIQLKTTNILALSKIRPTQVQIIVISLYHV